MWGYIFLSWYMYIFPAGLIHHEKCYCPEPDIQKWYDSMDCPASYRQIKQDLSIFKNVNMEEIASETISRFNKRGMHSLVYYKIIDNKVQYAIFTQNTQTNRSEQNEQFDQSVWNP